MTPSSFVRSPHVLLAVSFLTAICLVSAQPADPTVLDKVVVSATRTPNDVRTLGTVVDAISASDLARRQITSLHGALGALGAPLFASGAPGGATSLFLRGANSNQTLFLVDGIRFNDPNTEYAVVLGGGCVSACDSLEISHGPQSTLYGGEAIGGVISLRAEPGAGQPTQRMAAEVGSFGTLQGAASAQGALDQWSYNASFAGGHTDNDRLNNEFDSFNGVLRLDYAATEALGVGGTLRWFHGAYDSPGDRFTNDPDNTERENNALGTAFVTYRGSAAWNHQVTLGGQNRRFVSENPRPNGTRQITVIKNRRGVLDWQTTFSGWEHHRLTAGANVEKNHTRNTGFGNINRRQELLAFFAQDELNVGDRVFLTAGLRYDDFDTFGEATTGRATAAWLVVPRTLKLRASYGTAFRSPTFLDLYGQSAFYVGNPNLRPETARGWDAGVDYYLPNERGGVSVTWFETRYRDLIINNFTVSPSTTANVERARTQGLEVSFNGNVTATTELRVAYTYLEAENLDQRNRLLRRPRHGGSADLLQTFAQGIAAGVGVRTVTQREDIHARTFRRIDGEDFTVVRLHVAWQVNEHLTLKARVENLLDEHYEEVHGFPQLGTGVFCGTEWKF